MSLPSKMFGVQLLRHGDLDALEWSDRLPVPEPGAGEALVEVLTSSVNATDINTRLGWYAREGEEAGGGGWSGAIAFPRIQGSDLCGRVVALGPGTEAPPVGSRVICPTNQPEPTMENPLHFRAIGSEFDGAFAQFCVVPAKHLFDVSHCPLSDVELGAVPCAYGTAFNLLARANVIEGERVLVTGATGGVGLAAVQLANLFGASVTAQCSADKVMALISSDAAWLDSRLSPPERAFDVVIDVVGGPGVDARLRSLKPGGRYAASGAAAGPVAQIDLRALYLNDLVMLGCTHQSTDRFAGLVDMLHTGRVRPLVSATFDLQDIRQAQDLFISRAAPGKIALKVRRDR